MSDQKQAPPPSGSATADAGAGDSAASGGASFVEELLAGPRDEAAPGEMAESDVLSWSGSTGTLTDGRVARTGFSCLVRPVPGDRVLTWGAGDACFVLGILERRSAGSPAVISVDGAAALEASRIALSAQAVHISAGDLLTSARNIHAVADTSSETTRLRVTQVGTDVRRADNADDTVHGTLLQRMGTWMSTTVRDARLTARSFLFN